MQHLSLQIAIPSKKRMTWSEHSGDKKTIDLPVFNFIQIIIPVIIFDENDKARIHET
jgi:hypothetical protein